MPSLNRRHLLASAATPLLLGAEQVARAAETDGLPEAKYTLSVNLELMFPGNMPYAERIDIAADQGAKAFSFWGLKDDQAEAMLAAQKRHNLQCGSITGNGKTGWNTGLTKTGYEKEFLDDVAHHIGVAKRFGTQNLITFVGAKQKDIDPEVQHQQIISGLRKAGDLAEKADVYIVLEPLNYVESPQMSMLTSHDAFLYCEEAAHPRVKVDYDMYHRQLGEGNILNNLRLGLRKGWIRFVEIGDVPGRKEPGTGEANYTNIFRVLREEGYAGYIGLEHGTSKTPQHAIQVVRRMAGGL